MLTVPECVIKAYHTANLSAKYTVRVPDEKRDTDVGGKIYDVKKIHFHPGFNLKSRFNRISIIELRQKVPIKNEFFVKLVSKDYEVEESGAYEITRSKSLKKFEGFKVKLVSWHECGQDKFCVVTTKCRYNPTGAILLNYDLAQIGIGTEKLNVFNLTRYVSVAFHRSWIARITEGSNEAIRYETVSPDPPFNWDPLLWIIFNIIVWLVLVAIAYWVSNNSPEKWKTFEKEHNYMYFLIQYSVMTIIHIFSMWSTRHWL